MIVESGSMVLSVDLSGDEDDTYKRETRDITFPLQKVYL